MVTTGLWTRAHAIAQTTPDVDPKKMVAGVLMEGLLFSQPVMQLLGQVAIQGVIENLDLAQMLETILGAAAGGDEAAPSNRTPPQDGEEGGVAGSREEQAAARELDLRETGGPI